MLIVEKNINRIKTLCKNHNVEKLYLFGSATNMELSDDSDIDLLVRFKEFDLAKYFENYMVLKESLKKIFNREVDLLEEQTLKNPILIKSINKSKELIYG